MPSGRRCGSWGPLASRSVAPVLVAWAMFAALRFGTYAAGGADSFGYLSQAELFAQGRLTGTMPRHEGFDWPDVPATLTPLAYTRNAVAGRARARLPARPLADDGAADPDPPERGVPAGAVVRRVDRVAHGRARARDDRTGGWRARGAARRREPDVSAAGGTADERRAGRRAVALRPDPRAPAVDRCGDSRRRRLVAGHPRAAEPGAAGVARRRGVRHRAARARSPGRRVFAREPEVGTRDLAAAGGDAWRRGARRDPGRALRIAARVGLRLVRGPLRAVERRAEPGALSALDDRDAHAADLAVAARAAVVPLPRSWRESVRLDPLHASPSPLSLPTFPTCTFSPTNGCTRGFCCPPCR